VYSSVVSFKYHHPSPFPLHSCSRNWYLLPGRLFSFFGESSPVFDLFFLVIFPFLSVLSYLFCSSFFPCPFFFLFTLFCSSSGLTFSPLLLSSFPSLSPPPPLFLSHLPFSYFYFTSYRRSPFQGLRTGILYFSPDVSPRRLFLSSIPAPLHFCPIFFPVLCLLFQ